MSILVYGLECKYDRQQKKRGKGSLANSAKENSATSPEALGQQSTSNTPITPVTTTNSPVSSPGSFHFSIPPSHLFGGGILDNKDGLQPEFPCIPSQPSPQPQQEIPCKAEQESFNSPFSESFTDERSQSEDPTDTIPRPCFQAPESACYAYQIWNRGSDAFDPPRCPPSSNAYSIPPANYEPLPFIPICANCQSSHSVRLYPGAVVWLPTVPSQNHVAQGYGAILGDDGTYEKEP